MTDVGAAGAVWGEGSRYPRPSPQPAANRTRGSILFSSLQYCVDLKETTVGFVVSFMMRRCAQRLIAVVGVRIAYTETDCGSEGTCGGLWAEAHTAAGAPYAAEVSEMAKAMGRSHLDAGLYAGKAVVLARMLDSLQLEEGEDDTVREPRCLATGVGSGFSKRQRVDLVGSLRVDLVHSHAGGGNALAFKQPT